MATEKRSKMRRAIRVVAATTVALTTLAVWAVAVEPAMLRVRHVALRLPHWPAAHANLRVAVLSDLHVGSPHVGWAKLERIVALTNAEQADLVLLLGDYTVGYILGGQFQPPEAIAARLAQLRARLGVVAVLGNQDWWSDGVRVRSALEGVGITVLDRTALRLTNHGTPLWLAGLGDMWTQGAKVDRTLSSVAPEEPVLVLSHNPDVFPNIPDRVSLTLAGHTHGGQVRFPLVGRLIVPSDFGQRYAAGHIVEGGRHLFVTTGIGTSLIPARLGVVPEIVILTLQAE